MSSEQKTGVIVDAATFSPTPRHTYRHTDGTDYPAFGFLQLREDVRNSIREIDTRLAACKKLTEQSAVLVNAVREFVPDVPVEALNTESTDFLYWSVLSLMGTDFADADKDGAARPTKRRRKSGSRSRTAQ